jgi:hypothetical protein
MVAFFMMFMLPGVLSAQIESPDLKSGKKKIANVVVLPPSASLVKSGMKGAEPLVAEAQAMEEGLAQVLLEIFSHKGFHTMQDSISSAALEQNPNLKYALSDLQTRYDKMQVLLIKKPKDVRKGRFTLGDDVVNFAPGAASDALVFVRAKGVVPTAGLKTFVIVTGMGITRNYAKLDISVVDAQTGTVLYFVDPNVYGNFIAKPESMKEPLEKSLSDFYGPLQIRK